MTTPRGSPELVSAQAAPETTVNEQIRRTEGGANYFTVADRVTAPPGTCASGAQYLIIATATGAFAGKENQIAQAVGANAASGWLYRVPGTLDEGMKAYVQDEDAEYIWSGLAWGALAAGYSPGGTDVPIADGGTGASTAAGARSNLSVYSTTETDAAIAGAVAGLSWKQAVRAATTAAVTLATALENGDTIDGVTLATGDRILVKNQASPAENGIYVVAASGVPARASDADSGAELVNASVYVSEGTVNADTQWTCTSNAPITPGSTGLTFAQLATGGSYLPLTGGTLSGDLEVPADAYGAGWNGSNEVPTKNDVYDKIEAVVAGAGSYTDESAQDAVGAMIDGTLTYTDATPLLRVTQETKAADIASASTVNIGAAAGGSMHVTGTTTITAFDTATAGLERTLTFDGILTLTHNATSLILPGRANITTAAGDCAVFRSEGSGNWRCIAYTKASGLANKFRGALVYVGSNITGQNLATGYLVAFNTESYDTDSIHDTVTNNTRLTVPAGVSYIKLKAQIQVANFSAGTGQWDGCEFYKNGSGLTAPTPYFLQTSNAQYVIQLNSPVLAVSSGDYFELMARVQTDTSVDVQANLTWFAMEIVQ